MIAAGIGLVIMVFSVVPALSSDDEEEEAPPITRDPFSNIVSSFEDESAEFLNSSEVSDLLLENKTFIRHFYDSKDEMFSTLRTLDALDSIVVERISFASFCSSPDPICPPSAPMTLLYLPDSTEPPLQIPGVVSLDRLEDFIHGTLVPVIAYSLEGCDNCSLSELISILTPISDATELDSSNVHPALVVNPQDLAVPNFGRVIENFYTIFSGEIEVYSVNDSSIVFTSNPHIISECVNSSSLKVFFSPNMPEFEGYSICSLDSNISNCSQVSNTSCLVLGENPACNFTQGQRQYLELLSMVSPEYFCLPMTPQDTEVCSNVSDIDLAYALAQKHYIRSTPAYVISSGCKESVYNKPFSSYNDLMTSVCAVLGC